MAGRTTKGVLKRLDERLTAIEHAFQDGRKAMAQFDYVEMLEKQPEAVKRLRERYARLPHS